MKGEVLAFDPALGTDPAFTCRTAGFIDLGAQVDADQDEIQVDPDAQTPVSGNGVEGKGSDIISQIPCQIPDVSGIGKGGSLQFPEQRETVFQVGFHLEVGRLAGDQEVLRPGLYIARTQGTGLPAAHAVRAAAVELLFKWDAGRVPIGITCASQEAERERVLVPASEADGLSELQFALDVLGIRRVPDGVLTVFIHGEQGVEQAQDIAGKIEAQAPVPVGPFGNGRCVGRVVEHAAHAHVEVVHVGVQQEQVLQQAFEEILRDVEKAYDVGLEGCELIEEIPADVAGIAEGGRDHRPLVFGTVLVAETDGDVGMGQVRSAEQAVRQAHQLGNPEGAGDAEFRGTDRFLRIELEIPLQAQVEHFPTVEQVLMEVIELRGDTEQACGVDRCLEVGLESLDVSVLEDDVTVDDVVRNGIHGHVHAVEHAQVRKPGIGGVHRAFAVGHSGTEVVQVFQDGSPDGNVGRAGKGYVPDAELAVRLCLVRGTAAKIIPDGYGEGRGPVGGKGIGLGEEIPFAEAVITPVAEELGRPLALFLQGRFGKVLSLLEAGPPLAQFEFLPELLVFRKLVFDGADPVPLPGLDVIGYIGLFALVLHLAPDPGSVKAYVLEMVADMVDAVVHLGRVEDDGGGSELTEEIVPGGPGSIGPVVDGDRRVQAEKGRLRFLGQIRGEFGTAHLLSFYLDLVGDEPVLPFRQDTCRAAGKGQGGGQEGKEDRFALHSYKINTFPLLNDKNNV